MVSEEIGGRGWGIEEIGGRGWGIEEIGGRGWGIEEIGGRGWGIEEIGGRGWGIGCSLQIDSDVHSTILLYVCLTRQHLSAR